MVRSLLGLSKSTLVIVRGLPKGLSRRQFLRGKSRVNSIHADREEISPERKEVGCHDTKNIEECEWVPHPRSGIYFPKGHDWVMEDVPATAASVAPTYWLRNIDGVDVEADSLLSTRSNPI